MATVEPAPFTDKRWALPSLPTTYNGHLFRSRLEARWVIFFEEMNWRWEYEPEGFELERRIRADASVSEIINYLPDFWLPDLGVFAEVKGEITEDGYKRLLNCAAALDCYGGGCGRMEHSLVLLGRLSPKLHDRRLPFGFHLHKGSLVAYAWPVELRDADHCTTGGGVVARDDCGFEPNALTLRDVYLDGRPWHEFPPGWRPALEKAVAYRFEDAR